MRSHNSVGGFRIYPTSPADAEARDRAVAILAQFREGMDRFNSAKQLTECQQSQVDQLDPRNRLAQNYHSLTISSNLVWQLALEKQQYHNQGIVGGRYTTEEIANILNQYAGRWQQFKRQLDEQD